MIEYWLKEGIMATYRCVFRMSSVCNKVNSVIIKSGGIDKVKDGFWLNERFEFTQRSDCKYWIPPGMIEYAEKVKDEYDG